MVQARAELEIENKLEDVELAGSDQQESCESDLEEYSLESSYDSQIASKHDREEDPVSE